MKIEDQLKSIIAKAIKNGWDICGFISPANCETYQVHQWQNVVDLEIYYNGHKRIIQLDTIIFNHDFAKAFFGTREHIFDINGYCDKCPMDDKYSAYCWEYHLIQVAILPTDQRLSYFLEYLK